MKTQKLIVALGSALVLLAGSTEAQQTGTPIAPGVYYQSPGIYLGPGWIYPTLSGISFNPYLYNLSFNAPLYTAPYTSNARYSEAFGRDDVVTGQNYASFAPGFGFGAFTGGGGGFGYYGAYGQGGYGYGAYNISARQSLRYGYGIDEAISQERANRKASMNVARQDPTVLGPQTGEPSLSPLNISEHILQQEGARSAIAGPAHQNPSINHPAPRAGGRR